MRSAAEFASVHVAAGFAFGCAGTVLAIVSVAVAAFLFVAVAAHTASATALSALVGVVAGPSDSIATTESSDSRVTTTVVTSKNN